MFYISYLLESSSIKSLRVVGNLVARGKPDSSVRLGPFAHLGIKWNAGLDLKSGVQKMDNCSVRLKASKKDGQKSVSKVGENNVHLGLSLGNHRAKGIDEKQIGNTLSLWKTMMSFVLKIRRFRRWKKMCFDPG